MYKLAMAADAVLRPANNNEYAQRGGLIGKCEYPKRADRPRTQIRLGLPSCSCNPPAMPFTVALTRLPSFVDFLGHPEGGARNCGCSDQRAGAP